MVRIIIVPYVRCLSARTQWFRSVADAEAHDVADGRCGNSGGRNLQQIHAIFPSGRAEQRLHADGTFKGDQ